MSFPELTPFGRMFKLNGFTLGKRQVIPFAVMAQAGFTWIDKNHDDQGNQVAPKMGQPEFSAASVFLAGKANDYIGAFAQWTYSNLEPNPDGVSTTGHSSIDNTDLRLVGRTVGADSKQTDWIYGVTVHNNPTVQDVWNTTPAWGFPFTAAPNVPTPAAASLVDGTLAQQVVGLGGYAFWHKTLYTELTFYRRGDGIFSFLRAGQDPAGLDGYNPYWRVAYNREWGPNSLMVGTFGTVIRMFPDSGMRDTPTDQYTDFAFDAQYQYITNPHTITAQVTWISEKQDYRASYPATLGGGPIGGGPTPMNAVDHLRTLKLKETYYYQRKYGGTLAYFSTTGDADAGLYGPGSVGGSANSSPNSNGYIVELNYVPIQYIRLMLQYTGYNKFNGSGRNYDGAGRNASNNNTLFLNIWAAY
ncbi:MAG: cytochrome C [Nevskia sp.]|nr:cytochrome C [Nevskia sp.]